MSETVNANVGSVQLPTPTSRVETLLNAIATADASGLPTPINRKEIYLDYIARHGVGMLVPEWDATATYTRGDIVLHEGKMYKANQVPTTGTWVASQWDETDVSTLIESINTTLTTKADLVNGVVPSSQLPSYVSTIVEVATYADLPATGASNTIYVVKNENNQQYRWGGTTYIAVGDEKVYYAVSVINMTTMGELKAYVDGINAQQLHILLDLHNYMTDAYVCTAHFYTSGGVNYCELFDLLNSKVVFNANGFATTDTILAYCANHAKVITTASTELTSKANKPATSVANNIAKLDASGNLVDSGLVASAVTINVTYTDNTTGTLTVVGTLA